MNSCRSPTAALVGFVTNLLTYALAADQNFQKYDGSIYLPKFSLDDDLTMEIAVFVDQPLYNMYNTNFSSNAAEHKLTEYVKTVLNDIQLLYRNPYLTPRITFKVVRYDILKNQPAQLRQLDPYSVDTEQYLADFCMYQYNIPDRDWDHSLLLTGYDLMRGIKDYRITGMSRIPGVCDPLNSCTVLEGLDFSAPLVGAHELAHALGIQHDDGRCSNNHIMFSKVGDGRVGWSTCSSSDLRNYIDGLDRFGNNCLRSTKATKPALDLEGLLLPGMRFNAHEQCSMILGPDHIMVSIDRTSDTPCHQSICMSRSTAVMKTTHPALEGTMCSETKYCKYGRCVEFPPSSTGYPQAVHGGWTEWKRMPCHQCSCSPILGGIGVLASTRECRDPEPAENGRPCAGARVRGVVCDRVCTWAARSSSKSYVRAVCEARRRENGDAMLTGIGNRLADSACKIHCTTKSESRKFVNSYRFFGDIMPNGSPCGDQKFCVNGECLAMSCDGRVLLEDQEPCPRNPGELCNVTKPADWETWGVWSSCSSSCGSGVRSRKRYCSGDGCDRSEDSELENCQKVPCDALKDPSAVYQQWSDWSACSTTCGRGVAERRRTCKPSPFCTNGAETETKNCVGAQGPCSDPAMDWTDWSLWSSCSASCGSGKRTRTRFCLTTGCPGRADDIQPCNKQLC